jgi:cytochrome c oxidase assembly factor CtaG
MNPAMFHPLFAFDIWNLDLWYAVPAIMATSLVYAATRHERLRPILFQAVHSIVWITGFMAIVFAVIQFVPYLFP